MQEFIELANTLADEAGEIARKYFRRPFDIDHKEDESPVTIADKDIERRLRDILQERRPDDGVLGEEFPEKQSKNGLTWVIDPIDGTKPFMIGRPTFGTLIALCKEEVPVLGVIDQPIVKERWIGAKDIPTRWNGKICKTRPCPALQKAISCSTSPDMFKNRPPDFIQNWAEACRFVVWGGDCISYGLMALGHLDVIIEDDMQPHDYLALVPVVEGAGGKITDWDGNALTFESEGHVVAVGDPALLSKVIKRISPGQSL